jgi:hypothetical protein
MVHRNFVNGTTVSSAAVVGDVDGTWSVVGTGDLNGDGYSDIAWRDNSGNMAIWLMNGAKLTRISSYPRRKGDA